MLKAKFPLILRALVSGGLVLSLLTTPSLISPAAAVNPDCAPTVIAPDNSTRGFLFTSTTLCDWTVPANVSVVEITIVGGGGGGGGGSWSGTHGGGGGGGGGGGLTGVDATLTPSSKVSIQIGVGGSAGTGAASKGSSTGTSGGNGGSTIFNDTYTAVGGFGGTGANGDIGGSGGANGGNSTIGYFQNAGTARKSGGGQNNGNGGGGSSIDFAGDTATASAPAMPFAGAGINPRRSVAVGASGGGGANQTSSANGNTSGFGADANQAAIAADANTGSGGGGGHGCGTAATTCNNRNGGAGTSGFILVSFSAGASLSTSTYWPTTVGATPTWPTLSTYGTYGSVTWSVSPGLPAGISLNPSTGIISGSPTVTASYNGYYFTATDSYGALYRTAGWSLVVNKGSGTPPTFSGANIVYGVPTALTASGGSGTGALTFTTSSSDCVLSGTRGETVTAQKASGTCSIIAQKAGDDNWYSTSKSATFTMTKEVSTVSFTASPSSPKEEGSSITLTATTGAGQTGTVTFSAGGSPIASCGSSGAVTISGTSAVCVWTPTASGSPFTVGAAYSGDANYQSATASTLSYTIYPSIALSYSGISTTFGTAKTSTPTISGGTGSTTSWTWSVVKASDSSTVSGITINSSGVVSASSSVSTGTYAMRVNATDTVGITKTALMNVVVGLSNAASPTVASVESSMTAGGVVHLTASVLSAATGTIAFKYGSTTITGCGTVAISSGSASCDWTTTTATGSPFSVTAVYSGDGSYSSATSAAISITVLPAATFTYTSQNKVFGTGATVTPTITGGAGGLNTWTVVNSTDSNSLAGVYINQSGVVSISSGLGVGTYTVNIAANDANGIAGSGTLQITITQATTTMSIAAKTITDQSLTAGTLGRQVRLVATFNVPVMGSVTFSDARGTICNAFAGNLVAECWWAPTDATYSPYAITASFGGNTNGTAATSNTITNFSWNAAMSVSHANTRVETGKTVTISPTTSGGTGALSTWGWGISQYLTGNAIGGITINGSGVITVSGSILPETYTMVVSSADLAGSFYYNNVTITVSDLVAPDISLSRSSETATTGSAISGYTITNTGSDITSYSIDQSLPGGLSFSTSTGRITGTPTETTTALVFTLTANNFAGVDTATYTLTINAGSGGSSATITIALTSGAMTASKGTAVSIIATIGVAGKVKFFANGKMIGGCAAKSGTTTATCSWKPMVQGQSVALTALLNPTSNSYSNVRSAALNIGVTRRTGARS